jgi:replicative DNA helicase
MTLSRLESVILHTLIKKESVARKILPFLREEYFSVRLDRILFQMILEHYNKYNNPPTREVLLLDVQNMGGITDEEEKDLLESIETIVTEIDISDMNESWLVDETEKFCQERSVHNAILESISILNGDNKKLDKGAIPKILQEALSVTFNQAIGHDYISDAEERFAAYKHKEKHVPFDLTVLNDITQGGVSEKTLNIILAGTGVGKTLVMCHMASGNLFQGKNVLYVTLEMSEIRIAERIDANLLDVPLSDLREMLKPVYDRKMDRLTQTAKGKLIIKEYPTGTANVNHFRALLEELRIKKNFVPDILYIDYLNICSSSQFKMFNDSYTYVKKIAEELRGLAVEYAVPIVTATQTNRTGMMSSDVEMTDTSESHGTNMTADLIIALMTNEELQGNGHLLWKQLKNRYNGTQYMRRFLTGIDYTKMRLFELANPREGLINLHDETTEKDENESLISRKRQKDRDFSNLNFDE